MQKDRIRMDLFFQDPHEIPLPPEEVRLRELRAEPWPDSRRVKIYLEVDPFQKRPSAEVSITDVAGDEVASVHILESMTRKMEFNMHLRGTDPGAEYTVLAVLYFEKAPTAEGTAEAMVIDRRQVSFILPAAIEG